MKIALAAWAPFHAGAEVAAQRLAVGLRDAGHDVLMVVGTDGQTLASFRDAGLRCVHVAMQPDDKWTFWRSLRTQRDLASLLRREQPDLVHANDLPTSQMVGLTARRLRIPLICHHRWVFDEQAIDWLNKHGADEHVFVSHYLRKELCSRSLRLAAERSLVIHDGLPLDSSPSDQERRKARKQLGLLAEKLIVLLAGQVIERKGVADVLHAWREIAVNWEGSAELHVVGEDLEGHGAYRIRMEQLSDELSIDVRFHGFRSDVPAWLTASDLVLVPSHVEPLGNATLEAMAYGRPVIGTKVGGIPEMVEPCKTGLLIDPRSPQDLARAIHRLLKDADLRAELGAEARRRCERHFSIEMHVDKVLATYEKALNERRLSTAS